MYSGKYKITEHVYEIISFCEDVHLLCRDYSVDMPAQTVIEMTEADIERERRFAIADSAHLREEHENPPRAYLESLAVYRKIATHATERGMFLFHCSAVAVDGVAYAFTAKSGTGKSTHTALWRKAFGERAAIINDDKPIIGIKDGIATVYGTPWNGKHGRGANVSAPLKAICFLARGKENKIERVTDKSMVLTKLLNQTYRPKRPDALKNTLRLLDGLMEAVSFYSLECNMEDEAALVSYRAMSGGDDDALRQGET